jgi:Protein of unknown function (DUF3084)
VNFVEFIRGVGNVLLVMAIAGGVAYVGDRVGHQVGRKRLTLFNIRPRYTSTIIAIGTGMVIALVVTLVAIFASQEVKTAFFKLSSLNAQIADLQSRQTALEAKVESGQLVVATQSLRVPYAKIIKKDTPAAERLSTIQDFYSNAVRYVNTTYLSLGLKPYVNPPDIDKQLRHLSDDVEAVQRAIPGDVLLSVTAGQNLYVGDQIHFEIAGTPDQKIFSKGEPIYAIRGIPGAAGANIDIALNELQRDVSVVALQRHVPPFVADSVKTEELYPAHAQMEQMLAKPGSYTLTAYAYQDVYPHLGGIQIVAVLTPVTR